MNLLVAVKRNKKNTIRKDFLCFFRILPKIPKSFQILLSSLHYKLNDNSKTN